MKIQTQLFVIALAGICASCGTVSNADVTNPSVAISTPGVGDSTGMGVSTSSDGGSAASLAPAPSGESAPVRRTAPSQFAPSETFEVSQVVVTGATKVVAGRFVGDLVLDHKRSKVTGAGPGVTVIDGNLIVGDRCSVVGMTVTGDVIFRGNNSRVFVECLGQVLDYGMQNQH